MPRNFYPYREPHINDTGKTIEEVLREAKAQHERGKNSPYSIPPFTTRLEHAGFNIDNLKPVRVINIRGFGNLTDEDIAAFDPDERIYNEDKPYGENDVRLGDLRIYKAAIKKKQKATKDEKDADKFHDSFFADRKKG